MYHRIHTYAHTRMCVPHPLSSSYPVPGPGAGSGPDHSPGPGAGAGAGRRPYSRPIHLRFTATIWTSHTSISDGNHYFFYWLVSDASSYCPQVATSWASPVSPWCLVCPVERPNRSRRPIHSIVPEEALPQDNASYIVMTLGIHPIPSVKALPVW